MHFLWCFLYNTPLKQRRGSPLLCICGASLPPVCPPADSQTDEASPRRRTVACVVRSATALCCKLVPVLAAITQELQVGDHSASSCDVEESPPSSITVDAGGRVSVIGPPGCTGLTRTPWLTGTSWRRAPGGSFVGLFFSPSSSPFFLAVLTCRCEQQFRTGDRSAGWQTCTK